MSRYNNSIPEEELKNRIAKDLFANYDCTPILGKIDFCVTQIQDAKHPTEGREAVSLLWAEAKRGIVADIYKPFVQLILTIGKVRTFEAYLPPPFLAAFDAEKIAFIPYKEILPFFSLNDFNWNVTPSDESSREFELLYNAVKATLDKTAYLFRYDVHETELREFIRQHLSESSELIQINKNNFVSVYQRWTQSVKPSIDVDWELLKKRGLIDGDFFLADLLSRDNKTLRESLFVLLESSHYLLDRRIDASGLFDYREARFNDGQKAHTQFWEHYQRPPKEEFWDYIVNRRDLLVPQDLRERKGSFFTPQIWVELSQKYLADLLGENWQEEYYIWDCAAGTGNLLNGLTNKYNIWASTLDKQDVDVMKDRIKNGANLLESHVFQFDFLNDEFDCGKLPPDLLAIIQNPAERKKLVIYINPPYAEAGNARTPQGTGENKGLVARGSTMHTRYAPTIGSASNEMYALFLMRIYKELNGAILGQFSKLKVVQAPNFQHFREVFQAKLESLFLIPANTFDNVKGHFPIGFFVWRTDSKREENMFCANIYAEQEEGIKQIGEKNIHFAQNQPLIGHWINSFIPLGKEIGVMNSGRNDFQNTRLIRIENTMDRRRSHAQHIFFTESTLLVASIYLSVRFAIKQNWLNDRDQFLYPQEGWQQDHEFQNNCLVYTLFHTQNRISANEGTNHWIPFTEKEVNARLRYESHFMTDFISGKLAPKELRITRDELQEPLNVVQSGDKELTKPIKGTLRDLGEERAFVPTEPLVFSPEATAVFDAGRELWRYYHAQPNANPNASYYDIREYFQGRSEKGKMNAKSEDAEYNRLFLNLKEAMELLRLTIVPKVYEYKFLIN